MQGNGGLALPQRGIVTPGGFKPVLAAKAPLIDAKKAADEIFQKIGPARLEGIKLFFNWVLVAKWIPTEIGSLIASNETQREMRWQNRVGLVLKLGPTAFMEREDRRFYGCTVKPGDWVTYGASDGVELGFRSEHYTEPVYCLRIEDHSIAGAIEHPDFLI